MCPHFCALVVLFSIHSVGSNESIASGGKTVQVEFAGGKSATMVWLDDKVEIMTEEGKATVPSREIRVIRFGIRVPAGLAKQIETALKGLSSKNFKEREQAQKELIGIGLRAAPSMYQATRSLDPEIAQRAAIILKQIEADLAALEPKDADPLRPVRQVPLAGTLHTRLDDQVLARSAYLKGKIVAPAIKVERQYFGKLELPLMDLESLTVLQPPARNPETRAIIDMMTHLVDMKDFQNPMTLKEFMELLSDRFASKGLDLPILVSKSAFSDKKEDDGDRIYQSKIVFSPIIRKMRLADVLRAALDQVETGTATFLVRNGLIEITSVKRASPEALLATPVIATFEKQPLAEALSELADLTGVTIVVDPRLGAKSEAPVSAAFRNNIKLESAVRLLVGQTDLSMIVLDGAICITDAANASRLAPKKRSSGK